jgi:hypothetical protein
MLLLDRIRGKWSFLLFHLYATVYDCTKSTTALHQYRLRRLRPQSLTLSRESDGSSILRTVPDSTYNDSNNVIDPTCPFRSRYYPRIPPISFQKRKRHTGNDIGSTINKFWIPGQRTYIRNRFIQQQRKMIQKLDTTMVYDVEWLDDGPNLSKSSFVYSNIISLASLWNVVIDFVTKHTAVSNNMTKVIALPSIDGYIIHQWVNMLQWLLEQPIHHQTSHATFTVSYNRTIVDFMTIPTISLMMIQHPIQSMIAEKKNQHTALTSLVAQTELYDHEHITRRTKAWVQRILVDQTICPFTKSITYSGQGLSDVNVPVGKIAYHTSSSTPHIHDTTLSYVNVIVAICQLQSDVWIAIHEMLLAGPVYSMKHKLNGVSSILLAAPGWDTHFEMYCSIIFPLLENTVQILELTEQIGIVCFHPQYQTPDGRSFPGFGHMHSVPRLYQWLSEYKPYLNVQMAITNSTPDLTASNIICNRPTSLDDNDATTTTNDETNIILTAIATAGGAWQRRTPHATINILRADQLTAAESKRSTPTLYATNILRLCTIGWSQLQKSLEYEKQLL